MWALLFIFALSLAVSADESDVYESGSEDEKEPFTVKAEANRIIKKFILKFYEEKAWTEDEHFHKNFEWRSFGDVHHPMTGFFKGKQGWLQYRENFDKMFEREYYYFESKEHTDIGGQVVGYLVQIGGHYKDRPKLKWQAICYQFWTVANDKITKGTEVCSWHDGMPLPSRKNNIKRTENKVDPKDVEETIKKAQEQFGQQDL